MDAIYCSRDFDYYDRKEDREVIVHLAGGGNLLDQISRQVKDLGLSSRVVLHGALSQDELDVLFDQCTIAVGSLGLHRRSQNCRDSSLKTREYLAKGIPFIYAGSVDVFETDSVDFCLQFPSIEQPVDFFKVVIFMILFIRKKRKLNIFSVSGIMQRIMYQWMPLWLMLLRS